MKRRYFILFLSLFCTTGLAFAQQQQWAPSVEQSHLRGNIHLLKVMHRPGGHVNLAVSVGVDGLLLVDHAGDWRTITANAALIDVIRRHLASFDV
ncbi:MAG TPA: hypothetical protein VKP65_10815, partial [Rhodothermales bacterium]|nr:hypothetical protein [Rhodothermales bacterium]